MSYVPKISKIDANWFRLLERVRAGENAARQIVRGRKIVFGGGAKAIADPIMKEATSVDVGGFR